MNPYSPVLPARICPPSSPPAATRATERFIDFFTSNIRNRHTREAYGQAVNEFLRWYDAHGVYALVEVKSLHVATWIVEAQALQASALTVKAAARRSPPSVRLAGGRSDRAGECPPLRCVAPSISSARARHPCWSQPRRGRCSTASM